MDLRTESDGRVSFGDTAGRRSGLVETEGGKQFEIFEPQTNLAPELEKREGFKKFLYSKYGLSERLSPSEISDEVNSIATGKERALWDHVFGKRADYRDKQNLPDKSRRAWKNALETMRKNVDKRVRTELKSQQKLINDEMSVYDAYQKKRDLTPSEQLGQRKVAAWDARGRGEATPQQKELIGIKPKSTAKAVGDFIYQRGGSYKVLSETNKAIVRSMLPGTGLRIKKEHTPAKRKSRLGGLLPDLWEPNIPASTTEALGLMPRGEQAGLAAQGVRKTEAKEATGMTNEQIAEIFRSHKPPIAVTPGNMARFRKQNQL